VALLTTDAVVLQVRDYMESSRIVRLATREAGIVAAIAKGARRQRARTGSALDLFVEGTAQLYVKSNRELHTLGSFEAGPGRPALGTDLTRFLAASALAEVALRVLHEEANVPAYETLVATLDAIAAADLGSQATPGTVDAAVIAGVWRLVSTLGFAPALDICANCHRALAADEEPVRFAPAAGGVLCANCARLASGGRALPAAARDRIHRWVEGRPASLPDLLELRAHRRLLREFLDAHVTGDRPLRAWAIWDEGGWAQDMAPH